MVRRFRWWTLVGALIAAYIVGTGIYLAQNPAPPTTPAGPPIQPFTHVFVIMMENHSAGALPASEAPFIHHLMASAGYDPAYHGVTHVSLPNYVAAISGRTFGTHSDNPDQTFYGPTLASQMDARHIDWQAAMESLPYPGYNGNWYPEPPGSNPVLPPVHALYAKKHNPFALFPALMKRDKNHVVPLQTLAAELKTGHVPAFVWITPNLCHDMHGQPNLPGAACPANQSARLVRLGDQFLQHWVGTITHSSAWRGNSAIFIVWDEMDGPSSYWNPVALKTWLTPGPDAPSILGIPVGGGSVPLLVVAREMPHPVIYSLWADHYNLLKTIEAGFHLPYLGHAASSNVSLLWPFLPHR